MGPVGTVVGIMIIKDQHATSHRLFSYDLTGWKAVALGVAVIIISIAISVISLRRVKNNE